MTVFEFGRVPAFMGMVNVYQALDFANSTTPGCRDLELPGLTVSAEPTANRGGKSSPATSGRVPGVCEFRCLSL